MLQSYETENCMITVDCECANKANIGNIHRGYKKIDIIGIEFLAEVTPLIGWSKRGSTFLEMHVKNRI